MAETMTKPVAQKAPEQPAHSTAFGRFLYRHRKATGNPVGFLGYEYIRNALAAIPYGIATAAVWEGFERLAAKTSGAEAGSVKSGVNGIARSPVRDIAMIAAGFTLYRGTLKLVRSMKEHLFNPDYSPDDAQNAADTAGSKLIHTIKEIAPAEVNSTPYGAIALGLGRRYTDAIPGYAQRAPIDKIAATTLGNPQQAQPRMLRFTRDGKFNIHLRGTAAGQAAGMSPFKEFIHKISARPTKVWAEAGVFILSFLTFFEVSDRLFKDVQVRRGKWHGEFSSLTNAPHEGHGITENGELIADETTRSGAHPQTFGASDPNLLRLAFTRIIPTALGIGAYTFTKRASYAALGHFSGKNTFWKRAFVEGAATSTFFVMSAANDTFEILWKKLFEPRNEPVPLTRHQEQQHDILLGKLNQKAASQGRSA